MPPIEAQQHVAGLAIQINGTDIAPELAAQVVEVRVRDTLALPSSALVRLIDHRGEKVDDGAFDLGKELVIKVGAMSERSTAPVFKGEIVAFEPEFTEDGVFIAIRAYDKSHRLQRERKVRTFQDMSMTDIVRKLTNEAGLTGEVRVSGAAPTHKFFLQSGETDRELIARFERDYDCRFFMRDGRFVFSDADAVDGDQVTLKMSQELTNFRPRVSAVQQVRQVQVSGWDPQAKQEVTGRATNGVATSAIGLTRNSVADVFEGDVLVADKTVESTQEADAAATSILNRRADAYVEAEGACLGNPKVMAGTKLRIEGVGTKLSGTYIASSVTHLHKGAKGYRTTFTISGRSERGLLDLVQPPERPKWGAHAVVGLVTNVNDPDKLGRVKVKYPALVGADGAGGLPAESFWARIATLAASHNRGVLMLPEVNDEVVVVFENGDTRRPLIVGSVFNGTDKPGDDLLQSNDGSFALVSNQKSFVHTKRDMTFKSDENMIIEVTKDQTEKADGNYKHEAGSMAALKAGTSYTIEAGSSMTIKGATISVEAHGSLKLKGATVDIESSGPATFKGAMVDIQGSAVTNVKGAIVNLG
jgi:uncharacterized protein involved in type VI secretion and phage assembly